MTNKQIQQSNAIIYYFDEECTKKCPTNEKGEALLDWGITIPGKIKIQEIYAQNQSKDRLILRQPYTQDEDLHIKDYPANLMSGEAGKVKLELAINKNRIDGHHAGWGFDVIVG